jgi:hypothetical protein
VPSTVTVDPWSDVDGDGTFDSGVMFGAAGDYSLSVLFNDVVIGEPVKVTATCYAPVLEETCVDNGVPYFCESWFPYAAAGVAVVVGRC